MTGENMKTEQEIIKQLHTLRSVRPSDRLRKRIDLLGSQLHAEPRVGLASSIFFRPALAFAGVLLLVGLTGSGLVLSANQSKPGSLLFPVKKAVIQTQLHFTTDPIEQQKLQEEIPLVSPTASPTPKISPQPTKSQEQPENEDHKGEKEVKGMRFIPLITPIPLRNNEQDFNRKRNFSDQNQQGDTHHGEGDEKDNPMILFDREF